MPNKTEHIKKAEINEKFAEIVVTLENSFRPWAIVAYHYGALHWIDAYIAKSFNCHPARHNIREDYLSKDKTLKQIYYQYHQLKTDSELVRYNVHMFKSSDIQSIKSNYYSKIKNVIKMNI